MRMRAVALSLAALVLPLSLTGCGSGDDGDVVATDPAPTSPPTSATTTPTPTPSAEPTVGSYPEFTATDYTYELTITCFCMSSGNPMEVTVADGRVVDAAYGTGASGQVQAGDPVDPAFRLTINEVIAKANDTTADKVKVDWPTGQGYPNSVYVDGSSQIADDEVGYTIADVRLG
jgi:major membrane immunogen (membrane-anchored lipoprotein)